MNKQKINELITAIKSGNMQRYTIQCYLKKDVMNEQLKYEKAVKEHQQYISDNEITQFSRKSKTYHDSVSKQIEEMVEKRNAPALSIQTAIDHITETVSTVVPNEVISSNIEDVIEESKDRFAYHLDNGFGYTSTFK